MELATYIFADLLRLQYSCVPEQRPSSWRRTTLFDISVSERFCVLFVHQMGWNVVPESEHSPSETVGVCVSYRLCASGCKAVEMAGKLGDEC